MSRLLEDRVLGRRGPSALGREGAHADVARAAAERAGRDERGGRSARDVTAEGSARYYRGRCSDAPTPPPPGQNTTHHHTTTRYPHTPPLRACTACMHGVSAPHHTPTTRPPHHKHAPSRHTELANLLAPSAPSPPPHPCIPSPIVYPIVHPSPNPTGSPASPGSQHQFPRRDPAAPGSTPSLPAPSLTGFQCLTGTQPLRVPPPPSQGVRTRPENSPC